MLRMWVKQWAHEAPDAGRFGHLPRAIERRNEVKVVGDLAYAEALSTHCPLVVDHG